MLPISWLFVAHENLLKMRPFTHQPNLLTSRTTCSRVRRTECIFFIFICRQARTVTISGAHIHTCYVHNPGISFIYVD